MYYPNGQEGVHPQLRSFAPVAGPGSYGYDNDYGNVSPVFANGSGGAISGISPRTRRGGSYAPPAPPQYAQSPVAPQQQSDLDPAATMLAPPQMDSALRNQNRINDLTNQQQYRQRQFFRNSLQTDAAQRGDAAAKAAYLNTLNVPPPQAAPAPATSMAPPAPMVPAAPTAETPFPLPGQPVAPPPTQYQDLHAAPPVAPPAPASLAPPTPPTFYQSRYGSTASQKNADGSQDIAMQLVTPGTPAVSPQDYAQAEMQRRQNFSTLQGRGIQPPGSGVLAPPMTNQQLYGTPDQTGPVVAAHLRPGVENPNRAAADRAALLARANAKAGFDVPYQQLQTQNALAGQAIDAQAGYNAGHLANDTTRAGATVAAAQAAQDRAKAAQDQADAAMVAAKRPRQATPGSQPHDTTGDMYQRLLSDAMKLKEDDPSKTTLMNYAQQQLGAYQARQDASRPPVSVQSHDQGQTLPKTTRYVLPDGTSGVAGTPPQPNPTQQPAVPGGQSGPNANSVSGMPQRQSTDGYAPAQNATQAPRAPQAVFGNGAGGAIAGAQPPSAPQPANDNAPRINNEDDWRSLPRGTVYLDPSGNRRVKQ